MSILSKIFDAENFSVFTLTPSDVALAGTAFFTVITGTFLIGKKYIPEKKRLAWAISVLNSFVTMSASLVYLWVTIARTKDFFFFGDNGRELFESVDNFSCLVCLWFGMVCFLDLAYGVVFYPEGLQLLTGYIHHSVYIWIMIVGTTGNGGFTSSPPFASGLLFALSEEVPTFLLGLGSMFPRLRTDFGFGVTFFLLRIVFHVYMMIYAFILDIGIVPKILFLLTFALHAHWFTTWVTKYGSKLSKKGGKKVGKDSSQAKTA